MAAIAARPAVLTLSCGADPRIRSRLSAGNALRLTQVATGRVVPFTGLHLDVESEVEPFQTAARTTYLEIGRVAIGSGYDVVDDAAELGAEGAVEGTARFGLPHERRLRHSSRSGQSKRARSRLTDC